MTEKFANKYRIPSARLKNWDYRRNAAYFVTICTGNREHYFGKIINDKMNLSGVGVIADILWYEIKNHSKMVELDEYIVMPNHIHGIVIIHSDNVGTGNDKNNDLFGIKNGSAENDGVQGVADVGSGGHDVGSGGHDVGSGVVVV
ncbi:MAG TPA: hypothetical protein ENN90_02965, partial [Mariniphaga anaerophila]|nr:hypothetical protein [Mariniphaga anaerophila]